MLPDLGGGIRALRDPASEDDDFGDWSEIDSILMLTPVRATSDPLADRRGECMGWGKT
jgi:hypothetical protein